MLPGRGVSAVISGKQILAGNLELLKGEGGFSQGSGEKTGGGMYETRLYDHVSCGRRAGSRIYRPFGYAAAGGAGYD